MNHCERHATPLADGDYCPACMAAVLLGPEEEVPLGQLGEYEILEEIGRGGMGVVYRARQCGLNREVALKLLPAGSLAGDEYMRRFRREAEMAAKLRHPNIVQVFDAGQVDGELFYSMELVAGGTLADHFAPGGLAPLESARLTRDLALAVAHAHGQGVLHRDLKPSNVLMDDAGRPQVADFGLARPFDTSGDSLGETRSFGSPAYLAPELVRDPNAAGPASDLYSLGGILYYLLCGRPPFVSPSLDELLRQVRECEPPAPRLLNPAVPKDLQRICLKALDKHPARRYADAGEFADDLQRFLEGRPVRARPVGAWVKSWRAAKRAPWLTASLVALAVAMAAGIAGVLSQAGIANRRADEVKEKAAALQLHLYASDILAASLAVQRGDTALADAVLARWNDSSAGDDPRGFEWRHLKYLARPAGHRRIDHREATVTSVAASGDGRQIAVADQSGRVLVHPISGGDFQSIPWRGEEVAFADPGLGGDLVLGDPSGAIRWCDPAMKVTAEFPGYQFSLASTLPRAVIGSVPRYHWWPHGGSAAVVDWKEKSTIRELPGSWRHAVISADGRQVALAGVEGGLRIVAVDSGDVRELPVPVAVWALSFLADGTKLAAGSRNAAFLWDLTATDGPPLIFPHGSTVWQTAFSTDGDLLLTACSDRRARLWQSADPGVPPRLLSGHRSEVWCAAFLGAAVLSGGKDGDAFLWDTPAAENPPEVFNHQREGAPAFSPDGRLFLTQEGNHPCLHDLRDDRSVELPEGLQGLGFSPDGQWILLADSKGRIGRTPLADPAGFVGHEVAEAPGETSRLRCISGGRWIARVLKDGTVLLEQPANGVVRHRLSGGPPPAMRHATAGSPDGKRVAVCGDGESAVILHDLERDSRALLEPASSYYYVAVAFSPDGRMLAAGDLAGAIRIWDVASRNLLATLPGHPEETSGVAFSPDGRTLASIGHLQGLKLWHVPTWSEVHSIDLDQAGFNLVFSPDGERLAVTFGSSLNQRVEWLMAPRPE